MPPGDKLILGNRLRKRPVPEAQSICSEESASAITTIQTMEEDDFGYRSNLL
jgi:hypothetical protein